VIRPIVVLAGWGAMLTVLALVLLLFSPPQYEWALLAGAALGLAAFGVLLLVPASRPDDAPRPMPETSLPTVIVAWGLAIVVLGIAAGPWLLALGAEVVALGLFGLIREVRAQRKERQR